MKLYHLLLVLSLSLLLILEGCLSTQAHSTEQLKSVQLSKQIQPDGKTGEGEWGESAKLQIPFGWLMTQRTPLFLYLLIDVTDDIKDDPPLKKMPWGDFVTITIDVNGDKKLTPNLDLSFSSRLHSNPAKVKPYIGPENWGPDITLAIRLRSGFGASINSQVPHRIWEVAIPLYLIEGISKTSIGIGLEIYSQNPKLQAHHPNNLNSDFSNLITLEPSPEQTGILDLIVRLNSAQDLLDILNEFAGRKKDPDGRGIPQNDVPRRRGVVGTAELGKWIDEQNQKLLEIIKNLPNMSQPALDKYLRVDATVNADKRFEYRMEFIRYYLMNK